MSRKENDDFVATKEEKSFDDDGNTVVAELPKVNKTSLTISQSLFLLEALRDLISTKWSFLVLKLLLVLSLLWSRE